MSFITSLWNKISSLISNNQNPSLMTEQDKLEIVQNSKPFKMTKPTLTSKIDADLNDTAEDVKDHLETINPLRQTKHNQKPKPFRSSSIKQKTTINIPKKIPEVREIDAPKPSPSLSANQKHLQDLSKQLTDLLECFEDLYLITTPESLKMVSQKQQLIKQSTSRIHTEFKELCQSKIYLTRNQSIYQQQVLATTYEYQREHPLITLEQFANINYIFRQFSHDTTQLERQHPINQITYKNFCTLDEGQWLNDEVINTYLSMISRDIGEDSEYKIMNTYFSESLKQSNIERMLSRHNITNKNKLIIPIHYSKNHWLFILISSEGIRLYDSMDNTIIPQNLKLLCKHLFGVEQKQIEIQYPKQRGIEDCGVFMLCGIKALVYGWQTWAFRQGNINYKRLTIARDILCGKVGKLSLKKKDR